MLLFFCKCFSTEVDICLDENLYNEYKTFFDSLFSLFKKSPCYNMALKSNRLFIVSDNSSIILFNGTFRDCCFVYRLESNNNWMIKLIDCLETFFAKTLRCTIFHGAIVRCWEHNFLFLGSSKSGKTTLINYLVEKENAQYMDDDCIFLLNNGFVGFNFPMAMRCPVESYKKIFVCSTVDANCDDRFLYLPKKRFSNCGGVDHIFFPNFAFKTKKYYCNITGQDSFNQIINNVKSYDDTLEVYKDIRNLIAHAKIFSIHYSSSEDAIVLLKKIINQK